MFTDRYIKVPIYLYDRTNSELLDQKAEDIDTLEVIARINPFKIENYYGTITDDKEFLKENIVITKIWMDSGESFIIRMTVEEFEEILNKIK